MDISFDVDPSERLLSYVVEGTPTADETRDFLNAVVAHPDFEPGFGFSGDCRRLGDDPGMVYVRALAREVRARAGELGPCRWGLVFSTAGGFTAVRICSLLTFGSGIEFAPFRTPEEAEAWLCVRSTTGFGLSARRDVSDCLR